MWPPHAPHRNRLAASWRRNAAIDSLATQMGTAFLFFPAGCRSALPAVPPWRCKGVMRGFQPATSRRAGICWTCRSRSIA